MKLKHSKIGTRTKLKTRIKKKIKSLFQNDSDISAIVVNLYLELLFNIMLAFIFKNQKFYLLSSSLIPAFISFRLMKNFKVFKFITVGISSLLFIFGGYVHFFGNFKDSSKWLGILFIIMLLVKIYAYALNCFYRVLRQELKMGLSLVLMISAAFVYSLFVLAIQNIDKESWFVILAFAAFMDHILNPKYLLSEKLYENSKQSIDDLLWFFRSLGLATMFSWSVVIVFFNDFGDVTSKLGIIIIGALLTFCLLFLIRGYLNSAFPCKD